MAFRSRQFTRQNATALTAGGILLGVLGSRLLPPLVAMASGNVRARMSGDPFELLKQDHRSIEAAIEAMDKMGEGAAVARRTAKLLLLKRLLSKHATAEEDVVYPLLYDQPNAREEALRLYSEHAQVKMHLYHLEMSLTTGAGWAQHVRELKDLVARHIREEEDTEFPKLRNMMDEKRLRSVAGQIHREEAMVL